MFRYNILNKVNNILNKVNIFIKIKKYFNTKFRYNI